MGGRRWTDAEDATIRQMVALGTPHDEIGRAIGRTLNSVRDRAQNIGARMSAEHAKRNNVAGNRAMHADPVRKSVKNGKITASYTPERRARMAEVARQVNAQRDYGRLSQEARKKLSDGIRRHNLKRLAWLPEDYRAEYTKLVHRIGAAEAERRIRAKITPFERQMQAIRNGARLIEKPVYRSRPYDFTLGGVSSMEGT